MSVRKRTVEWQDPTIIAKKAIEMSGKEFLEDLIAGEIPPPPISQVLGFGLTEIGDGTAVFTMNPAEYHYNPIGSVHGGVIATLLDSAMGCAVQTKLDDDYVYTTTQLNINYVRGITVNTPELRCIGEAIHIGRSTATAEAKIVDKHGKLYAHGTTTCLVMKRPKA